MINSKLDLFMLGMMSSKANVGIYSIALQIAGTAILGQTIVNAIIGPKIARMHASGDKAELKRLITNACILSSLAAIASLVIILPFGDWLIRTIFGADFAGAYGVSLIVISGLTFSAMMGPVVLVLNMTGYEKVTARVVGVSAIMNAVLNAILIPLYEAHGAAVATAVTTVTVQYWMLVQTRRRLGIHSGVVGILSQRFWMYRREQVSRDPH
jgi:O-antigen/teichoic acid export membrane protein